MSDEGKTLPSIIHCFWLNLYFQGHRFIKPFYTNFDNYLPLIPVGIWRCDVTITKVIDEKEELVFGYREFYEITPKGIIEF